MISSKILLKILPFIILFITSCSTKNGNNESGDIEGGTPVKVTAPVKTDLSEYITLNAVTEFQKKEVIRTPIQGFIKGSFKKIGEQVISGDKLFLIQTKEASAAESLNVIIDNKTFSGEILIKAHSSGILSRLNFNSGDYVSEGELLAVVSIPSSLQINLQVPFQYTNDIKNNSEYKIILPGGKNIYANVERIVPVVDQNSQTQKFILRVNNKVSLPESLNVNVKFPIKKVNNVIAVPKSSVMSNETLDEFWVMKLINDSTAVKNDIEKGIETDSLVQVLNSKLKLTDRMIYSGAYGLPDTAKIKISD